MVDPGPVPAKRLTDRHVLHMLVIELGAHVVSVEAMMHASLEDRALRAAWVAAFTHLEMTEAMAREYARTAFRRGLAVKADRRIETI